MELALQHAGIYCRNLEESIEFYVNVLDFEHLYSTDAMEGDKPLRMAWVRNSGGTVIELLEQEDKATLDATAGSLNHISLRVDDMDEAVARLEQAGVAIEAGPFETEMLFDRDLPRDKSSMFKVCGTKGCNLKIMFFRGPGNERFEFFQDNIAAID